ncbi:hypothetical protein ACLOJK_006795, partial [Asimina triloba]
MDDFVELAVRGKNWVSVHLMLTVNQLEIDTCDERMDTRRNGLGTFTYLSRALRRLVTRLGDVRGGLSQVVSELEICDNITDGVKKYRYDTNYRR